MNKCPQHKKVSHEFVDSCFYNSDTVAASLREPLQGAIRKCTQAMTTRWASKSEWIEQMCAAARNFLDSYAANVLLNHSPLAPEEIRVLQLSCVWFPVLSCIQFEVKRLLPGLRANSIDLADWADYEKILIARSAYQDLLIALSPTFFMSGPIIKLNRRGEVFVWRLKHLNQLDERLMVHRRFIRPGFLDHIESLNLPLLDWWAHKCPSIE